MGTTNLCASRAEREQIAQTRLEIKELTDAWTRRHRLRPGTPEYIAALETEERLVTRIWRRLRGDGQTTSRTSMGD
jgi:molecular chaperone DnaK (HSP70)